MSMQQLLPLEARLSTGWRGWVRHRGVEEAIKRMALWLAHGGWLWLDSEGPAGKSLLLRLVHEAEPNTVLLCGGDPTADPLGEWLAHTKGKRRWLVDLSGAQIPRAWALAAFHLIERARAAHADLVIAVRASALEQAPPEFASRVRAMPRVEMRAPSDDEALAKILRAELARRQWDAPAGLVETLLLCAPRTLEAQLALLERLDREALAERARVSKAWVLRKLGIR